MTSSNRKLVPAAVPSGISPGSPQLIPVNIYHYENIRILSLVWIVYELKRNLMKSKRIVSEQKSFYIKGILFIKIDICDFYRLMCTCLNNSEEGVTTSCRSDKHWSLTHPCWSPDYRKIVPEFHTQTQSGVQHYRLVEFQDEGMLLLKWQFCYRNIGFMEERIRIISFPTGNSIYELGSQSVWIDAVHRFWRERENRAVRDCLIGYVFKFDVILHNKCCILRAIFIWNR